MTEQIDLDRYPHVYMTVEAHDSMSPEVRTYAWRTLMEDSGLWPCFPVPHGKPEQMLYGMACIPIGLHDD